MSNNAGITVGEMIERLQIFDKDAEIHMGGLTFYRFKDRGPKLVQLEFNETVYKDRSGTIIVEQH